MISHGAQPCVKKNSQNKESKEHKDKRKLELDLFLQAMISSCNKEQVTTDFIDLYKLVSVNKTVSLVALSDLLKEINYQPKANEIVFVHQEIIEIMEKKINIHASSVLKNNKKSSYCSWIFSFFRCGKDKKQQ